MTEGGYIIVEQLGCQWPYDGHFYIYGAEGHDNFTFVSPFRCRAEAYDLQAGVYALWLLLPQDGDEFIIRTGEASCGNGFVERRMGEQCDASSDAACGPECTFTAVAELNDTKTSTIIEQSSLQKLIRIDVDKPSIIVADPSCPDEAQCLASISYRYEDGRYPSGQHGDAGQVRLTIDAGIHHFAAFGEASRPVEVRIAEAGVCGNGVVETGEECDPGFSGEACTSDCTFVPQEAVFYPGAEVAMALQPGEHKAFTLYVDELPGNERAQAAEIQLSATDLACRDFDTHVTLSSIETGAHLPFNPWCRPGHSSAEAYTDFDLEPGLYQLVVESNSRRELLFDIQYVDAGLCGDGIRERGENCDDGNVTSGDGCDARCNFDDIDDIDDIDDTIGVPN